MEIGLYTFAELSPETTGGSVSQEQRLRDLLEEVELAEQVGLDVFGVGEHHRPDFVVSAPAVVLAAAGGPPGPGIRPGTLGLPMALAIIGGEPARFAPFAKLHRQAALRSGHDPAPALSINSHGFIAEPPQEALDDSFPAVAAAMNRIGRERNWAPMTRADYDNAATLQGANFVGSAQQVVEKILFPHAGSRRD